MRLHLSTKSKSLLGAFPLLMSLAANSAIAETTLQTRLGPLTMQQGYPTKETSNRLYDEMDFQRATQAYLWALPAVGFKALMDANFNTFGARPGDIVLYQDLKDKAGMLTPNITTLYAFSFWDLSKNGQMVIDVPAGATAGGVLDIWQQPVSDMGQTGPDKGSGGKYLILAPNSPDIDAPGYRVFRSSSNQVWFGTRGLDPDKAVAKAIIGKFKIYSWNDRANPVATRFVPVGGRAWTSAQPNTLEYWRLLSELYRNEPVAPRDRMMFGMLSSLGISPGKPFNPNARQAKILTDAAQVGELMARTIAFEKRYQGSTVYPGKHWEYAILFDLDQENPAKTLVQFDERSSWFYEAIGMSVGMQGRTLGAGQVYIEVSKDKNGNWLSGSKFYKLHVDSNPPVKQFWSITLYDNVSRGPLITSQGLADLSSRKPDLITNPDGSVDLYFGPTRPANATNWIQTNPGKGYFHYFRFYGPLQAYFDKTWQLNDIEPIAR